MKRDGRVVSVEAIMDVESAQDAQKVREAVRETIQAMIQLRKQGLFIYIRCTMQYSFLL